MPMKSFGWLLFIMVCSPGSGLIPLSMDEYDDLRIESHGNHGVGRMDQITAMSDNNRMALVKSITTTETYAYNDGFISYVQTQDQSWFDTAYYGEPVTASITDWGPAGVAYAVVMRYLPSSLRTQGLAIHYPAVPKNLALQYLLQVDRLTAYGSVADDNPITLQVTFAGQADFIGYTFSAEQPGGEPIPAQAWRRVGATTYDLTLDRLVLLAIYSNLVVAGSGNDRSVVTTTESGSESDYGLLWLLCIIAIPLAAILLWFWYFPDSCQCCRCGNNKHSAMASFKKTASCSTISSEFRSPEAPEAMERDVMEPVPEYSFAPNLERAGDSRALVTKKEAALRRQSDDGSVTGEHHIDIGLDDRGVEHPANRTRLQSLNPKDVHGDDRASPEGNAGHRRPSEHISPTKQVSPRGKHPSAEEAEYLTLDGDRRLTVVDWDEFSREKTRMMSDVRRIQSTTGKYDGKPVRSASPAGKLLSANDAEFLSLDGNRRVTVIDLDNFGATKVRPRSPDDSQAGKQPVAQKGSPNVADAPGAHLAAPEHVGRADRRRTTVFSDFLAADDFKQRTCTVIMQDMHGIDDSDEDEGEPYVAPQNLAAPQPAAPRSLSPARSKPTRALSVRFAETSPDRKSGSPAEQGGKAYLGVPGSEHYPRRKTSIFSEFIPPTDLHGRECTVIMQDMDGIAGFEDERDTSQLDI